MKVSGFTFLRNAIMLGYPAVESIRSVLPICDEFIVNVGRSEDGTMELINSMNEPKVKIIETDWNDRMSLKGFVYAQQKTIAQYSCTGDWAFYLEADEVVHEDDLDNVYRAMERHLENREVEALVFDYIHFYGNHVTCVDSPGWYRREVRIIRNSIRTYSPDSLFFLILSRNRRGRYPRAALANARIFHYGWVRSEEQWNLKAKQVSRFWGKEHNEKLSYINVDPSILKEFKGTHPSVMKGWLPEKPREFTPDPNYRLSKRDLKYRIKGKLERILGVDLCKKHFTLVG